MYQALTIRAENMTYAKIQAATAALRQAGFTVHSAGMDSVFDRSALIDLSADDRDIPKIQEIVWEFNNGMFVG